MQVVASDPPDGGDGRPSVSLSNVGEPPFFLYCNHCRWDSAEVGITFEKPTGLAGTPLPLPISLHLMIYLTAQLQKFEDSAPESLEFERLKEHFEPFLRTSSLSSLSHVPSTSSHHLPTSSATAAASAALARDVPGVGKYNPLTRSRVGRDRTANKDEMPEYKSRMEISILGQLGSEGDGSDVEALRRMEIAEEIASLEQRWGNSWTTSFRTRCVHLWHVWEKMLNSECTD